MTSQYTTTALSACL